MTKRLDPETRLRRHMERQQRRYAEFVSAVINKPKTTVDPLFICPVTQQPCLTEQDEFCEDYGCARKAGIDVDGEL